ncbi:MAG TPA: alpha/beta hydrolase, partial [Thermomicrobiales bacterium]|nr:alpha/beta hydrolase [Thermomicrobiales bacterium]
MPKIVVRSGLKFHYQQVGNGPDVVMIHGLTGNLAVWHLKIIPLLWDHYRITTYDLRGHGYSEVSASGCGCTSLASALSICASGASSSHHQGSVANRCRIARRWCGCRTPRRRRQCPRMPHRRVK